MKDLRWRVRFFELWLERGNPYAFSLPAFFFPQVNVSPLEYIVLKFRCLSYIHGFTTSELLRLCFERPI